MEASALVEKILEKVCEMTLRDSMGPTLSANVGVREVRLCGRIGSLTKDGYGWDVDPKHAEISSERS